MQSMGWVKWILAAGLLSGCMEKPKPILPPPEPAAAGPQELARIRQDLRRDDPNAEVGQVEAVMTGNHLVAIKDVPVQDFPAGQAINIVNPDLKVIAHAVVDNVSGNYVVARYEVVARDPRDGDLAIRLSERRPPPSVQSEAGGAGANDTNAAPAPSNPTANSPKSVETPANNPPPADNTAAPQKSQPAPANNETVPSPAAGPGPGDKAPTTEPAPKAEAPAHSPSELNK